jgi:spermidine/putrescine transport system substrate-binding protein
MMEPEIAALNSEYSRYANAILGSEKFLPAELAGAPEMMVPLDGPAPEFVPSCPKDVRDKYDAIWADLTK